MPIGGGYNWTLPLLQQINRQGDIMIQGHQLGQEAERNALQKQVFNLQIADKLNALVGQQALRQALMSAGGDADLEATARTLIQSGRPEGLELLLKAKDLQAKGGYSLKPGEKRFDASGREISTGGPEPFKDEYSRAAGRQLSLDELIGAKTKVAEAGRQTINLPKITLERESGLVEQGIKDIKESKKDVLMSRAAIDRIDQALAIVEKQGDKVAGVQGQIRRALAPFAKTIGMDVQAATDAQILDSLLTAGAGSLRSQVVGPGPVTNYEQEILQKVSGGRMSYADGIKAVLEEARNQHAGTIDRYNEQINTISGIKGYENIQGVFKPLTYPKRQSKPSEAAPVKAVKREGIYNGKRVVEYEDGSIEYAD